MAGKPKSTKAAAREIDRLEEARQAAEYRKNAMSLREIGRKMGFSHEKARTLVLEGLAELRKDMLIEVDEYRSIQIRRREEIIEAHRPIATDPDHEKSHASAGVIHAQETAIAKLMGTEEPIQVEQKTEMTGDGASVVFQVHTPDVEPPFTPPAEEEDGDDDQSA